MKKRTSNNEKRLSYSFFSIISFIATEKTIKRRQIFPVQRLVGPAELAHEIGPTDSLHWLLQGVGDTGKAIFGSSLRL